MSVASILASDGRQIGMQVTKALGAEQSVLVYMNGTAGTADLFTGMASKLAERGITSYSITSRTHLDDAGRVLPDAGYRIHSDDLDRVVNHAISTHPDTPVAIAGTSLGAVIAMHYNATRNTHALPIRAFSPVVLDRFLPFTDKAKLAASLVSSRASGALVNTPMSVGRTMTTNPASAYVTRADEMAELRVPARVFRDVARMNLDIARHGSKATGKLDVVLGGADEVGINPLANVVARRAAPDVTVRTFPRVPHEQSQEWHDPRVVDAFAGVV